MSKSEKRENLLVVCAGFKSLHYGWIEKDRSYDILVVNYEKTEISSCGEEFKVSARGKKWELISQALSFDDFLQNYRYIALFDDDMRFVRGGLNLLFSIGKQLKLDLFQPSIDPILGHQTGWIHLLTAKQSDYRMTNLVEVMVPILTPELFIKSRPVLQSNPYGWGLDSCFWPTLLAESKGSLRAAIIDRVVMEHTRPQLQNYGAVGPVLDMHKMMERLKLEERGEYIYIRNSFHPDLEVSDPLQIQVIEPKIS